MHPPPPPIIDRRRGHDASLIRTITLRGAEIDASSALLSGYRTLTAVIDGSYQPLTPTRHCCSNASPSSRSPFRLAQARVACADNTLPAAVVVPALARLVEQSLAQAVAGRFQLLETLRTYATGRLPEPARLRLHAVHARDVANRIAGLLWQQRPESEPECVAASAGLPADLRHARDTPCATTATWASI
jgi:hypothetical protein